MLVLIGCVFVSSKENEELSSLATILKSEKKFASSNYLNVEPISYDDDEESYLVITKDSSWANSVHYVTIENNKVKEIIDIDDLSGTILNHKRIILNNKTYWQFDISNHQGNGKSCLFSVEDKEVVYEISGTIDYHLEGTNSFESIKKQGFETKDLVFDNTVQSYKYSMIYHQKRLESYIKDINNDGYDDFVFHGQQMLVKDNFDIEFENYIPEQIVSVEKIYYYDSNSDSFKLYKKK